MVSFDEQKLCSLMLSHLLILVLISCALLILVLISCALEVLLRKFLPVPVCWSVEPMPSSNNFTDSGLTSRSLIHLELTPVQGER